MIGFENRQASVDSLKKKPQIKQVKRIIVRIIILYFPKTLFWMLYLYKQFICLLHVLHFEFSTLIMQTKRENYMLKSIKTLAIIYFAGRSRQMKFIFKFEIITTI